jgi:hypothetical protein
MGRPVATSLAVGVLATLTALVGIDARATLGARVTGDEPQYLLTATSLGEDGDLDISDELAARRFSPYHEVDLDAQTMPLDSSGRQVSPHDPLLPAIAAVPMRLGGWAGVKATLAMFAGLTAAVTTWVAIRRCAVRPAAAAIAVGAAFVGLPLAAYGAQVYPELPAALALICAVAVVTAPQRTWRHDVAALVAVVALPWLAIKYLPVAAVLGVALLVAARADRRRLGLLAGSFAVAGALYLLAHRGWYGGWTVYAAGDHFAQTGELSAVGTQVNLLGRARRLAGLLVDRDFGIAAWSPVWLLAPLGLGLLARQRMPGRWVVLAAIGAGWLNATFVALTMHGFWIPGRQVVVVLPLAALGLAVLAARARAWAVAIGVLGALSALNWLWLAIEASTGRRTLIVDFAATAAWPYRALRPLLPDGLQPDATTMVLLVVWGGLALASLIVGWVLGRGLGRRPAAETRPLPAGLYR